MAKKKKTVVLNKDAVLAFKIEQKRGEIHRATLSGYADKVKVLEAELAAMLKK